MKSNTKDILAALKRHGTLTLVDLAKKENLGYESTPEDLIDLIQDLCKNGLVNQLDNVHPPTYTITNNGINEG